MEIRLTVLFTKREIEADQALHLSKITAKRRHRKTNPTKEQKVSAERDRAAEPVEVQCRNIQKEEEADPDLEYACNKEAERGHVRAKGLMHHMHGQKAKIQKGKDAVSKGKDQKGKDPKGKDHKSKGKSKGKDKGSDRKPVQRPRNIENLSEETLEWHDNLCKHASKEDVENHRWRYEVFKHLRLVDEDSSSLRTDFCESAIKHLHDLDKRTNYSVIIGPGRHGESNDKIRLDLKFDPKKSEVSVPKSWADKGIVKTTYCLVINRSETRSAGRNQTLLAEQVPLNSFFKIDDIRQHLQNTERDDIEIVKMICILRPYVDDPAGFRDHQDMPVDHKTYRCTTKLMNLLASTAENNKS